MNKKYYSIDAYWYLILFSLVFTVVTIFLVKPEWSGRIISISFWYVSIPLSILALGFFRSENYFWSDSPIYKWSDKRKVDLIARIIVISFAFLFFYLLTFPLIRDIFGVLNGNLPIERTAYVNHTRVNSITGLLLERVVLDEEIENRSNSFSAYFFTPRHIMKEKSYKFLILPNSRLIVEASEISF